jgi:hypothetical protein
MSTESGSQFPSRHEAASTSFEELEAHANRLSSGVPDNKPDAWRDAFHKWATTACVFRDRCFGGIGSLLVHFCEWTDANSTVTRCTRQTFERLLTDADFLLADGFVSCLILAEDGQATAQRCAEKINKGPQTRKTESRILPGRRKPVRP